METWNFFPIFLNFTFPDLYRIHNSEKRCVSWFLFCGVHQCCGSGSGMAKKIRIRDHISESGIRDGKNSDPEWEKIRIRDKHPGSATLFTSEYVKWNFFKIFSSFLNFTFPPDLYRIHNNEKRYLCVLIFILCGVHLWSTSSRRERGRRPPGPPSWTPSQRGWGA